MGLVQTLQIQGWHHCQSVTQTSETTAKAVHALMTIIEYYTYFQNVLQVKKTKLTCHLSSGAKPFRTLVEILSWHFQPL